MKRKRTLIAVFLVICLAWTLAACGNSGGGDTPTSGGGGGSSAEAPTESSTPPADVIEMKLAYPSSPDSATGPLYETFAKSVNENSGGSIHVTTFPSETLVASPEVLDAVRNGQADFGHVMIANASAEMPDLTPLEVPGAFSASRFLEMAEQTAPIVSEIFEQGGVKYLATMNQGSMTFITNKTQVKTPADLVGKSMRTSGKWAAEAIQAWGGSPVTIPIGDVSTSLERGTVDGGYCGWVIVVPFGFYEFVEYVTYTNLQAEYACIVMNPQSYEKLTDEQKKVIDDAADEFVQYSEELAKENYDKIYKTMEEHGNVIYELTVEEDKAFSDAVAPLIEKALEGTGDNGKKLNDILAGLR